MELISIITPVYKSELFIEDSIKSVIDQSYTNWELILIDDSSPDNSGKKINEYKKKDKRIIYERLSDNCGAAIARNRGLQLASGKLIAFLDSDDIWLSSKLEKQIDFMINGNFPICCTSYELIDENSNRLNKVIHAMAELDLHNYLKDTRVGFSTVMINKELVGNFRMMNIRTRQDGQLLINLLKHGHKIHGIDEILCRYRVHKNSISANKVKATIQIWRLYYKIEKLGFFKSIYYFTNYLYNAIKKRI